MALQSTSQKALVISIDARAANDRVRAGVGRYCNELLRAMGPLAGDDVLRIYLDAQPADCFPAIGGNAEIVVLEKRRGWNQRVLGRELRRNPPDVFFAPVLQIPVLARCPVVAMVHDLAYFEFGGQFTWSTRTRGRLLARYAVRRAQHLLALSQATKNDLLDRFQISSEFVTTTLLGVSKDFHPARARDDILRLRKTYGLPDRYVLYVGRIQPRKNIERLIDAFGSLRADVTGLQHGLVIAGDRGWMDGPIFEHARRSPAADSIHFVGHVDQNDLGPLMAHADVLALVSLWEGFGMPVVEAMACGTAVVVSNCSSLPEVAGDAALTVDPYDVDAIASAIRAVVTNDELRRDLVRRGLQRAAQFTWERTAQLTLDVLRNVALKQKLS